MGAWRPRVVLISISGEIGAYMKAPFSEIGQFWALSCKDFVRNKWG